MAARRDVRPVDRAYARSRLEDAHAFRQQADVTTENVDSSAARKAAASSAVLAAIAAADAACGHALGEVWKGEHAQAHSQLARVTGGRNAATALKRIIAGKTEWQYLTKPVSPSALTRALRQADQVIEFAERLHSGRR